MDFQATRAFAQSMDAQDPLAEFRQQFIFPNKVQPCVYFCGHSLGLQPKRTQELVMAELTDWGRYAIHGHIGKPNGWLAYHELVTDSLAKVVGAKTHEVVAMNSLTTNLHLLLASFYRPKAKRIKILIEKDAFPSDIYAIKSQMRWHGINPDQALITVSPRPQQQIISTEDIIEQIDDFGEEIALVLLGQVNYLTGQAFNLQAIIPQAHEKGCLVGLDLAHGAGNLELHLHQDQVDFAVWCHYKYMNGGPGTIAGAFVHEQHVRPQYSGPRLEGWWGHDKASRFAMKDQFKEIPSAEAWQLSNPPILQLAALRASLELFDQATMPALRRKSELLTNYLEFLLESQCSQVKVITPKAPRERGCQLSLRFKPAPGGIVEHLDARGIICDFRSPDIIRAAPVPLYNSFEDVFNFVDALRL